MYQRIYNFIFINYFEREILQKSRISVRKEKFYGRQVSTDL